MDASTDDAVDTSMDQEAAPEEYDLQDDEEADGTYDGGAVSAVMPDLTPDSEAFSSAQRDKKKRRRSSSAYYSYDSSTPMTGEFPRGTRIPDETFVEDEDGDLVDTDEEDVDQSGYTDTSYLQSVRRKLQKNLDKSLEEREEEAASAVRRSKRITKGMTFQFWRNERPLYMRGRLKGYVTSEPTPVKQQEQKSRIRYGGEEGDGVQQEKPRRKKKPAGGQAADRSSQSRQSGRVQDEEADFSPEETGDFPVSLPDYVEYLDLDKAKEEVAVWNDETGTKAVLPASLIFRTKTSMEPFTELPVTSQRLAGKEKPALAAQGFSVPEVPNMMSGWISGVLLLLPMSVKDEEGVGECAQVFHIGRCQKDSVEVAIADPSNEEWRADLAQRVLLNEGDSFRVPPGNIYRLENHSTSTSCAIYWTIIKPIAT